MGPLRRTEDVGGTQAAFPGRPIPVFTRKRDNLLLGKGSPVAAFKGLFVAVLLASGFWGTVVFLLQHRH